MRMDEVETRGPAQVNGKVNGRVNGEARNGVISPIPKAAPARGIAREEQSTNRVLMVEPRDFQLNRETKQDNFFQTRNPDLSVVEVGKRAYKEFHALRDALREQGIKVETYIDRGDRNTPDSLFPNNWFSTHGSGLMVLYPMRSQSRRRERRPEIVSELRKQYPLTIDLSGYEQAGKFLEGTGSLVLDRQQRLAYACISPRTDAVLLRCWASLMRYRLIPFKAADQDGHDVYHTNVVMGVGTKWATVCLDAVADSAERARVRQALTQSGKEVIALSHSQMNAFCGNVLEVRGKDGRHFAVMSDRAWDALTRDQRDQYLRNVGVIKADLSTIEKYGGGGARCMIAELFPV